MHLNIENNEAMKTLLLSTFLFFSVLVSASAPTDWLANEKQAVEAEMKLYPNPVKSDKVNISFESHEISEVRIMDITGKEVIKKIYQFPVNNVAVDVQQIPNGIYIIQVKTNENVVVAKKLMVSRK